MSRSASGLRAGNAQLRMLVVACCQDFYHSRRRHSSAGLMSPIHYQTCCGPSGRSEREPSRFEGEAQFADGSFADGGPAGFQAGDR
jgi:hypothetical protein